MRLFTTTRTASLNSITPSTVDACLKIIQTEVKAKEVDEITVEGCRVNFRNRFFSSKRSRGHMMNGVDQGSFEIDPHAQSITYTYSYKIMFYTILGMSLALGGFALYHSGRAGFILFMFCWLFGMNWIITFFQHKKFFKRMKNALVQQ